jgi:hypothetical protein
LCALRGAVGPDSRTLTPLPPRGAPRLQGASARQVEDVDDHLTPVQRFERAIKRRDAARPKPPSHRVARGTNPQAESGRGLRLTAGEVLRAEVCGMRTRSKEAIAAWM